MTEARAALHALADKLADLIETPSYYTQSTSPIPKSVYLRLFRTGVVTGSKIGTTVLVERDELDAYIAANRVQAIQTKSKPVSEADLIDTTVANVVKQFGARKAG